MLSPPFMGKSSTIGRIIGRAALASAGVALGVALVELLVRGLRIDRYDVPVLRAADGRDVAQLDRIRQVFERFEGDAPGSLTQMPPDVVVLGWYDRPRWSYFDAGGCVEYRINSLGFRDHEFPLEKPAGEFRVIAIGDSFTFGQGVQLDDSWPQQLERELRKRRTGAVEVVNAGYCRGNSPAYYAEWLPKEGMKLAPDRVIVAVCLNDLLESIPLVALSHDPVPPLHDALHAITAAHRVLSAWWTPSLACPDLNLKRLLREHSEEKERFEQGLLQMRDTCAQHGVALLVAIAPMLTELRSHYPFRNVHQFIADFCRDHGIECVDLLDRFLGRDERDLWVHATDQHPNDVGQRLIAEGILEQLER